MPISVISVSRAKLYGDVAIVRTALILIANQQGDRRPRGFALKHTRQNLHLIRLLALRDMARRPRTAAIQLRLNVLNRQGHARRTAVNHATNRWSVRLAKIGDAKNLSEGASCHLANLLNPLKISHLLNAYPQTDSVVLYPSTVYGKGAMDWVNSPICAD